MQIQCNANVQHQVDVEEQGKHEPHKGAPGSIILCDGYTERDMLHKIHKGNACLEADGDSVNNFLFTGPCQLA